jgi:hypothetical protein
MQIRRICLPFARTRTIKGNAIDHLSGFAAPVGDDGRVCKGRGSDAFMGRMGEECAPLLFGGQSTAVLPAKVGKPTSVANRNLKTSAHQSCDFRSDKEHQIPRKGYPHSSCHSTCPTSNRRSALHTASLVDMDPELGAQIQTLRRKRGTNSLWGATMRARWIGNRPAATCVHDCAAHFITAD